MAPVFTGVDGIREDPAVTDPGERRRLYGQSDHVRLYDKAGFASRLKDAGFVVSELGANDFGASVFEKNGITSRSILYVVSTCR